MLLSACGSSDNNNSSSRSSNSSTRGTLLQTPPTLMSTISAETLAADLTADAATQASGPTLLSDVLSIAGVPQCDVNVYHIPSTPRSGSPR